MKQVKHYVATKSIVILISNLFSLSANQDLSVVIRWADNDRTGGYGCMWETTATMNNRELENYSDTQSAVQRC